MMKIITKDEWIKLLQRDLIKHPDKHDDGYKDTYNAPENLVITVTTRMKIRRNYTFGGGGGSATLDFSDPDTLSIRFSNPLRKPCKIKWQKVKAITLCFISA